MHDNDFGIDGQKDVTSIFFTDTQWQTKNPVSASERDRDEVVVFFSVKEIGDMV